MRHGSVKAAELHSLHIVRTPVAVLVYLMRSLDLQTLATLLLCCYVLHGMLLLQRHLGYLPQPVCPTPWSLLLNVLQKRDAAFL